MAYATAAAAISGAARQLGLVTAAIVNPFASTDANILQMAALLTSLGRKLALEHPWSQLITQATFDTVASQEGYTPPADFNTMVDQSGWNRTSRFPLAGPMSSQAWQYLKAMPNAATLTLLFRKSQGQLLVYPTPTSIQTLAYEYNSSYWAAVTATPTVRAKDYTDIASDVLFFDPELLVLGLKYEFLAEKGLPSQKALDDFQKRLEQCKGQEPAPTLSLVGESQSIPLLDNMNVPFTGFGS